MPDSLARHCHASERLINNAQSLVSGTTLQIRIGQRLQGGQLRQLFLRTPSQFDFVHVRCSLAS